jgi:hypothetical protein
MGVLSVLAAELLMYFLLRDSSNAMSQTQECVHEHKEIPGEWPDQASS